MLYKQAMEKLSWKGNDQKLRIGWWSKISFRNLRKLVGARSSSSFHGIVRSSVVSELQCTDRTLRTRRLFFHWKTQKHWTLLLSQLRAPWTLQSRRIQPRTRWSSLLKRFHCEPNTFCCSLKCIFFSISKQPNTLVKMIGCSWWMLPRNYRSVSRMIVRVRP